MTASTGHRVIHGDCVAVLRDLARQAVLVDSVVTDPPYHFTSIVERLGSPEAAPIKSGATGVYARGSTGFMGQEWDGGDIAFRVDTWRRVFDVLKPGGHLIAFASTKGYHRMVCAIEDAGFEIRDMVPWLYGTGFPKSHAQEGEFEGWGTALKPAIEPVVLAQKPLSEDSVEANLARWGVGAINIDECRISIDAGERFDGGGQSRNGVNVATHQDDWRRPWMEDAAAVEAHRDRLRAGVEKARQLGRFPANLCHDGSEEVLDAFAVYGKRGASAPASGPQHEGPSKSNSMAGAFRGMGGRPPAYHDDAGTAARFFYSSKATQGERIFECRICGAHQLGKPHCGHENEKLENGRPAIRTHPTVKPVSLMEWYVRMVTPPGGLVLDPFAGTGTTAAAARECGFQSLSIEMSADHVRDIGVRLGLTVDDLLNSKVKARPVVEGDQRDLFGTGLAA